MIQTYAQFINWHFVPDEDPTKKPRKVPFNPVNGFPVDPHDPKNWKTFAAAQATGHPVGFVLTKTDPFFFLDLDDCRDVTGWTAEATAIFHSFPGAAAEISISGKGMHIMGMCNQAALQDRKHKFGSLARPGNWLEFYTDGRFIALGNGFAGNFNIDWTEQLLRFVPQKPADDGSTLTDGPVPEYTGPADDAELIRRMLAARGSMGAMFGTKASAKDLWEGDAANLSQVFPSPSGDVYDRSSADASLMAHLAFWTGKDAARMDRLFRQSALFRPTKYGARQDYRESTIKNAIGQCRKVYDVAKSSASPAMTDAGDPGSPGSGATADREFLFTGDQIEHFAGCVYVRDMHKMMIPGGTLLRSEQFNATYGGKVFAMSAANDQTTKKAFEAFTENRAYKFPKAETTCFQPRREPGIIIDGAVNVYYPTIVETKAGDPSRFLDLVAKLLPVERDRQIVLTYAASLIRNPGIKFQWAPVLQGVQGNGKTLLAKCIEYAVGQRYTHCPAAEDLGNPFNAYIENKLLISVEEVHLQGKRELLDTLKPLITNNRIEVQAKGIDKRMIDNFANWVFCTNHRDAVLKTKDDRRYAVFFTAQQSIEDIVRDGMGGGYFPALWDWLRADGFAIIANYLKNDFQIIAEFDPAGLCHRAPDTSTTMDAIHASLGRAEQEVAEMIEAEEQGFRQGWISMARLDALFKDKNIRMSRQKVADMLSGMGYQSIGRANKMIMGEDGKRPILYVSRALYNPSLSVDDYVRAQGYAGQPVQTATVHQMPGRMPGT